MRAAVVGRGRCLALIGDAGLGKTRLADECTRIAVFAKQRTAWGGAWRDAAPFWPWQEVLRQLGENETAARLDGSDPNTGTTGASGDFAMFRAVADAVASSASNQPVFIVLDDVHLGDLSTLRLSRFVARSIRSASATLLLTSRPATEFRGLNGDDGEALSELLENAEQVVLNGLGVESIRALVAHGVGSTQQHGRPSDAMVRDLADLTGGNPLLLNEALAGGLHREPTALVDRVGRLLRHRLEGLDEMEMAVLAVGAVLGPTVTVHEIAVVSGLSSQRVHRVLEHATRRGLVTGVGVCVFAHGLLRETLLREIGADGVCALQARCADALEPGEIDDGTHIGGSTRLAKLRIAVAQHVGGESIAQAVHSTRQAATRTRRRHGVVATASMLHELVTLVEDAGQRVPADLLVELGRAELAGGNVGSARRRFDQVIEVADDPTVFTHAVLGRGELAVFEHRSHEDIVEFESLVETAHERIGASDKVLRLRLEVLVARERWMRRRGPTDAVSAAVDAIRLCGDATATANALSSLHHVLLGPEHMQRRQELTNELLALAPQLGDAFLALNGSMWRTVDLFLAGDAAAVGALRELRAHADALRARSVLIVADRIDVMLLVRSGRFEEAAEAAKRSFDEATGFGDADAFGYYAGHLMAIRWIQGCSDDLLDMARLVADQPTLLDGDEIYAAGLAALASQAGGPALADAAAVLNRIEAIGFANIPVSSNWLVTLQCLGEAAIVLGRRETCETISTLLNQFSELPVMGSMGTICVGPAARIVGLLHLACGRTDRAVELLERAHVVAQRLEDRPFVAIGAGELGLALLHRAAFDDLARAGDLIDEAYAAMSSLGMDRRAGQMMMKRSEILANQSGRRSMRRTDEGWEFRGACETAKVASGKGFEYLARLVATPNVDIAADDLAGTSVLSMPQDLWDEVAMGALRKQATALRERIEEADATGDPVESESAQRELSDLVRSIRADTRPDGSSRAFGDTRERARTAVTKAISRAIRQLGEQAPALAAELQAAVHTGRVCSFEERGLTTWVLDDRTNRNTVPLTR